MLLLTNSLFAPTFGRSAVSIAAESIKAASIAALEPTKYCDMDWPSILGFGLASFVWVSLDVCHLRGYRSPRRSDWRGGELLLRNPILQEGDIQVTIPYWIYRRDCHALIAMGSSAKPEDYIVAVLEGHVRGPNL